MRRNKLTNKTEPTKQTERLPLTDRNTVAFRICFSHSLHRGYDLKSLKPEGLKNLHNFLEDTAGKGLSISQVEDMLLRTKGNVIDRQEIAGKEREIIHFGKDRSPFRIFGYYDEQWYFVICRIDQRHEVHKS